MPQFCFWMIVCKMAWLLSSSLFFSFWFHRHLFCHHAFLNTGFHSVVLMYIQTDLIFLKPIFQSPNYQNLFSFPFSPASPLLTKRLFPRLFPQSVLVAPFSSLLTILKRFRPFQSCFVKKDWKWKMEFSVASFSFLSHDPAIYSSFCQIATVTASVLYVSQHCSFKGKNIFAFPQSCFHRYCKVEISLFDIFCSGEASH